MTSYLANIATLGAAGRVEAASQEYARLADHYQATHNFLEQRRQIVGSSLDALVASKTLAVEVLREIQRVIEHLAPREREIVQDSLPSQQKHALSEIKSTLGAADMAKSIASGGTTGVATAVGAWALVGAAGTASTGTAIGGLSGAAAFNATLAWFGGGAVAAGGGGMAAGAIVLGGVALVPIALVAGLVLRARANRRIAEIQAEASKLDELIAKLDSAIISTNAIELRANEMTGAIEQATAGFRATLQRAERSLHPTNPMVRAWHGIRRRLSGKKYSKKQLERVATAGKIASNLARLVDQPLLTTEGLLA